MEGQTSFSLNVFSCRSFSSDSRMTHHTDVGSRRIVGISLCHFCKAEYGEGASLQKIVPALARISYVARLACSVAVVLYGAVAILLGSPRLCAWTLQAATCGKAGPMAGRGLVR